nr:MAG: hypothetical protein [Marsupenaeus japonicus pemonivirus]
MAPGIVIIVIVFVLFFAALVLALVVSSKKSVGKPWETINFMRKKKKNDSSDSPVDRVIGNKISGPPSDNVIQVTYEEPEEAEIFSTETTGMTAPYLK